MDFRSESCWPSKWQNNFQEFLQFPKIQDFLEHVQDWKIPLSRFSIRKGLKAHVPWIESISKVPTTFNENLMTKLGLKDLGQTLPSKSQLDFSLKILT